MCRSDLETKRISTSSLPSFLSIYVLTHHAGGTLGTLR